MRATGEASKTYISNIFVLYDAAQVHGIVHDTIDFVRGLLTTEMNSATDNPIVLVSLI